MEDGGRGREGEGRKKDRRGWESKEGKRERNSWKEEEGEGGRREVEEGREEGGVREGGQEVIVIVTFSVLFIYVSFFLFLLYYSCLLL